MANITVEAGDNLQQLLLSNKGMEEKVQRIVRKVLESSRDTLRARSRFVSSKAAYLAIRKSVYKKILGGNLNIAPSQFRAKHKAQVPPVYHRLEYELNSKGNHRGGNRMPRSRRTEDLLSYWGTDRGFILRFLNAGTPNRSTNGTRPVGRITGNDWFVDNSLQVLDRHMGMLDKLMNELIEKEFNKK